MDSRDPLPSKIEDIPTIDLTGDDEHELEVSQNLPFTECRLCFDRTEVPVATLCGHIYCMSCLTRALEVCGNCPVCHQTSSFIRLYY